MKNEIQTASGILPSATTPQQTIFTQQGDNGLQIANQKGGTVNVFLSPSNETVYNATNTISTEYYNLFVIGGETVCDSFFLIQKDRAITVSECVAPEVSAQFAALTPEAISIIKTFPSLVATENRHYGRTDDDHLAMFGFVTDVRIQENGIKVHFQKLCSIPQQRLNEIAANLAINGASAFNELNRMHWTIKRINLVEELKAAGISVLVPT